MVFKIYTVVCAGTAENLLSGILNECAGKKADPTSMSDTPFCSRFNMPKKRSILFVCLGNICRSPIAEAVFLETVKKRGISDQWHVESAAMIDFHRGKSPDSRAMRTLEKFGITDYSHKARVTSTRDLIDFDYIFGMDDDNMSDLASLAREVDEVKAKISLLGEYDPEGHRIVPDPFYEKGDAMFEQVYHQCVRCCEAFLKSLQ